MSNNGYRVPCLFVAEKPSIARTLAEVLSKGHARHRSTVAQTNPCYDFELEIQSPLDTTLPNGGKRMNVTVTSVRGHLMSIDFESKATKNWRRTAHRELFDASIERTVSQGLEEVAQNLRNEAARTRVLVIWTDCDREGEAIGEEIFSVCAQANPRLIVKRARFSAANATDLWRAVNSLRELNQREIDAVCARQEIDLRLGSVFTRFQTISLGDRIAALDSKIVSFGPCQFPTLGFIVDRYEAILSFQRESFWQIKMAHSTTAAANEVNDGRPENQQRAQQQPQLFFFNWGRHRLYDHALAIVAFDMCVRHPEATVIEVTRKPTFKRRPLPLSTVELQIRASKWLKLDSETAMKAAESLYQRGIISYPRTETEIFADSFDLRAIVGEFRGSPEYGGFASRLLDENGFETPRRGSKNDEAHPPIHPTKWVTDLKELPEIRVYELVCRHFLACCAKDATGSESVLKVKVAAETFTAKGLVVHERNFLDVYVYERWGERSIPDLREGDVFIPSSLELIRGETTPPDLLSEADLIRLMDKNGIGTDATIQDHIKTVLEREYATKLPEKQNRFAPSNLGVALVRAYNTMGHEKAISRPELRSEMERDLVKICRGEKSKEEVVRDTVTKYREVFLDVLRKRDVMLQYVESVFMGGDAAEDLAGQNAMLVKYDTVVAGGFSACGGCRQYTMELRRSSQDGKLGLRCVNPQCTCRTRFFGGLPNSTGSQLAPRQDGFLCPICQYQIISVTIAAAGDNQQRSWFFCPSCFTSPPLEALPGADLEDLATMPCYKCTKSDCAAAGSAPEDPVMPCPECRSETLVLKKRIGDASVGGFFSLRCKGFPTCKGGSKLPKCTKEVSLSDETCSRCQARKLVFTLMRNKVPPGTPLVMTECPNFAHCRGQSQDFKAVLEMENLLGPVPQRPPIVSSIGSTTVSTSTAIPAPQQPRVPSQPASLSSASATRTIIQPPPTSLTARPVARANAVPPSAALPTMQSSHARPTSTTTGFQRPTSVPVYSAPVGRANVPARPPPQHSSNSFVPATAAYPRSTGFHQSSSSSSKSARPCKSCGQQLVERVSNSQNNPGRAFFKCDPCNVFEWADAPQAAPASSELTRSNTMAPYANACYHCGQTGHFPVQCPKNGPPVQQQYTTPQPRGSGGGGARAGDVCFKCNLPGHWSSQCPNNTTSLYPQQGPRGPAFSVRPPPAGPRGAAMNQRASSKSLRRCQSCQSELQPRKRVCGNCGFKPAGSQGKTKQRGGNGDQDDDEDEVM